MANHLAQEGLDNLKKLELSVFTKSHFENRKKRLLLGKKYYLDCYTPKGMIQITIFFTLKC